jgi:hypothetical protein
VITVPSETLKSGKTYVFKLDVSKVQRDTVHAYQSISIEPGSPLELTVTCLQNCESRLNPSSRFVLGAKCDNCDGRLGVEYDWTLLPGQGSVVKDLDWEADTLTGKRKRNLVVKAGVFSGLQPEVYTFKISGWLVLICFVIYIANIALNSIFCFCCNLSSR